MATITNEAADQLLRDGLSVLGPPFEIWRGKGREELRRVSHPDWHSTSWLTLSEVYASLEHFALPVDKLNADFRIILSTMKQFEEELGPGRTRLVFWFDS